MTQTLTTTFNPNDNGNDNSDQTVALATSSCTKDFIEIESSAEICYSPITYTRFCGFTLSTALGANTEEAARSGSDNTICGESTRGHRELLDRRLCRPDSEQRPLVSNFITVSIVKLCCHNFTQIANFMIFFCLIFLIDLLTYPY